MTSVKLMGALPGGDNNGAAAIGGELVRDPHRMHPMLVIVDCRRVSTDADTGEQTATVRVRRIEALLPDDLPAAQRLLRRALEHRLGKTVLPLDLEDEITAAFEQLTLDLDGDADESGDTPDDDADEPGDSEADDQHDDPDTP
jgi:hypothetical protein